MTAEKMLKAVGEWLEREEIDICPICNNHIFRVNSHPADCPFTPYLPPSAATTDGEEK